MGSARRARRLVARTLIYVGALATLLYAVLPFVWVMISSISPAVELKATPPHLFPEHPTLENYQRLLFDTDPGSVAASEFKRALLNTVIVGVVVTFGALVVGSLAAYAFARLRFRGGGTAFLLVVFTQMLPSIALAIPLYVLLSRFELVNTLGGLVLVYSSFVLPFVVWVMRGYFQSIPRELEDAALIDGCSRLGALLRVVVPLSAPGLVATAIFSLLAVWSEFLLAVIFTSTEASKTVSVVAAEFSGRFSLDYGGLTASAVLASLPPVLFAVLTQRFIISGLTS